MTGAAALAEVVRGGIAESVHHGHVAVVDAAGGVVAWAGDPRAPTFTRSALKPLQAVPFVEAGGPARFGFAEEHVALMCASHSGEPRHVEGVRAMLAAAGNDETLLGCGAHAPVFHDVRGEVPPPPPYSPLAHNCSGKHAGMLAACRLHGWPVATYLDPEHPLQAAIRRAVSAGTGTAESALVRGIDGCSAPNYALPLAGLARAFARLAGGDGALATLRDAMTAHPEMVSGAGRSDALLMATGAGDWVTKIGAEGVQAIGVRSLGLGIAIKVADGAKRALVPATIAVLDQLGLLDDARRAALAAAARPSIRNYRGLVTGEIRAVVTLAR